MMATITSTFSNIFAIDFTCIVHAHRASNTKVCLLFVVHNSRVYVCMLFDADYKLHLQPLTFGKSALLNSARTYKYVFS
jgi:hypothetical protein